MKELFVKHCTNPHNFKFYFSKMKKKMQSIRNLKIHYPTIFEKNKQTNKTGLVKSASVLLHKALQI